MARIGRVYDAAMYRLMVWALFPLNLLLSLLLRNVKHKNSVLHVSGMIHTAYDATRILRRHGMKADYLAIGPCTEVWRKCDYQLLYTGHPAARAMREFLFFWKTAARYEIFHLHFVTTVSEGGWELFFLKLMGRKVVIHYRGCEIRNRTLNMSLHPDVNICQECDYGAVCEGPALSFRRKLASRYGDAFLVTTPDMRDFAPNAIHLPFFAPDIDSAAYSATRGVKKKDEPFNILHITVHPGIEGTAQIEKVIESLKTRGFEINFTHLKNISHEEALRRMAEADLTIGKMKMGYYANAQIESLMMGTPAVTWVRLEFLTEELERSGLIITPLSKLEETLEEYLSNPDLLAAKGAVAHDSILRIHDNEKTAGKLIALYESLISGK